MSRSRCSTAGVSPRREADFEAWAHGVVAASRQFPGHLGASVLDAPGSREYHILFSFADRKSLRAWLDSDERRRWLARVGELIEADRGLQQLTGLETWFQLPGSALPTMKPPPRWKMWLVSIIAVYPLVLAFQALVVPRMVGLPLPLRALTFPLVLLTLMTFVVMPVVTGSCAAGWVHNKTPSMPRVSCRHSSTVIATP